MASEEAMRLSEFQEAFVTIGLFIIPLYAWMLMKTLSYLRNANPRSSRDIERLHTANNRAWYSFAVILLASALVGMFGWYAAYFQFGEPVWMRNHLFTKIMMSCLIVSFLIKFYVASRNYFNHVWSWVPTAAVATISFLIAWVF